MAGVTDKTVHRIAFESPGRVPCCGRTVDEAYEMGELFTINPDHVTCVGEPCTGCDMYRAEVHRLRSEVVAKGEVITRLTGEVEAKTAQLRPPRVAARRGEGMTGDRDEWADAFPYTPRAWMSIEQRDEALDRLTHLHEHIGHIPVEIVRGLTQAIGMRDAHALMWLGMFRNIDQEARG